jgi:hypothetical protein
MTLISTTNPTIHYVSAPFGAGKTYAASRYIADNQESTSAKGGAQ